MTIGGRRTRREGGDGAAGGRRRVDGDGYGDNGTKRQTREELAGLASRLKLARAQLVSAEQRWNGLVERAEFYEEPAGERDDDRGGGDDDEGKGEGEGGGGGTISNGGGRSQGQGGSSGRVIISLLLLN